MIKIKFPFIKHDEKHPKFEFDQIDDSIFIGTNQCCQTHFDKKLLDLGIEVDISLEEERLDAPFGVKFFFWLPTKDHTSPTPEQLKIGAEVIGDFIKLNKKIYIHCKNGHGRAPTLVAAYYISLGLTVEESIKKIQNKRKTIHLEQSQVEALDIFKQNLN